MVGFGLAPRINAAGRLERAMRAVEMLTTEDPALAAAIAEELDLVNSRRQELERAIVQEAQEMIKAEGGLKERGAIVLGKKGWHAGVIGIVASRLVDYYHRPTVVVAFGDEFCPGLGAVGSGLQSLRGDPRLLGGADRLRRPRRGGRAEADREPFPHVRPAVRGALPSRH